MASNHVFCVLNRMAGSRWISTWDTFIVDVSAAWGVDTRKSNALGCIGIAKKMATSGFRAWVVLIVSVTKCLDTSLKVPHTNIVYVSGCMAGCLFVPVSRRREPRDAVVPVNASCGPTCG